MIFGQITNCKQNAVLVVSFCVNIFKIVLYIVYKWATLQHHNVMHNNCFF